jgi:putative peptide zinc metalloprotease protein
LHQDHPGGDRASGGPRQPWVAVPRLAPGVELLGEYQGSGLAEATYLVRQPSGQVVHLSCLLHLVLSAVDGRRTVAGIAARVTAGFGRTVSAGNIEYLLAGKIAPLGLLATGDAQPATGTAAPSASLLALKLRVTIVPEAGVQYLARLFRPLFSPFVVVVVLVGLVASDTWLLRSGRLGAATDYVLYHPLLVLVVIGLTLLSTLFHECGHAAACRYGGARPGVIGMGFYVLWPAFFTNTTDAYRLGRAGRVRTDLGGVYFNAIFVLALTGAYRLTGLTVLADAVVLSHVEIVQQLMPSLRFDGYFILADLIGVPDLFRRIGPTLRGLIPGQPRDPRVHDLKRRARLALTAWVLLIVPLFGTELTLLVLNGSGLVRTFVLSLSTEWRAAVAQFGRTEISAGLVTVISMALLILPMAGLTYLLLKIVRTTFRRTITATRGHPARRSLIAAGALVVATSLAAYWGVLPLHASLALPRLSAFAQATVQRPDPAPAPAPSPAPSPSPSVAATRAAATRAAHRAVVLDPVGAAGFDALEGLGQDPGNEDSAEAAYAIDGNPATAWLTQYYLGSPFFGGLKKGAGLILDMGRPVTVSSVTITFGRARGADVSVEVGNHNRLAAATLPTFTTVASADGVGGTHTFTAGRAVRGRYVLIWFTKLPPAGPGWFAAKIFSIVIRGSR